jgi:hypothetical protein
MVPFLPVAHLVMDPAVGIGRDAAAVVEHLWADIARNDGHVVNIVAQTHDGCIPVPGCSKNKPKKNKNK